MRCPIPVYTAVGAFLALGTLASASTNLIVNGNFEQVAIDDYAAQLAIHPVLAAQSQTADALAPGGSLSQGVQSVTGWYTQGYNFLMTPGSATTGGAGTSWNDYITFWGSSAQNGGSGSVPIPATSPTGGNFIALDSAYIMDSSYYPEWPDPVNLSLPLSQDVSGLTIGQEYELSFWWAAAQQRKEDGSGYNGDTWEYLTVNFGEESFRTTQVDLPEHGYRDWVREVIRFTATNTSQTLSFLAGGGPDGQPPFVFLDGVSMEELPVPVPEPGSVALVIASISGIALLRYRSAMRRRKGE